MAVYACQLSDQMQQRFHMSNQQLLGKHKRLKDELSAAYAKPTWEAAHINRITSDLAVIEHLLAFGKAQERGAIEPESRSRKG